MSIGNISSRATANAYPLSFYGAENQVKSEPLASLPIIYLDDPPPPKNTMKNVLYALLAGVGILTAVYLTKSKALASLSMDGVIYSKGMPFSEAKGVIPKAKMLHIKTVELMESGIERFSKLFGK